MTKSVAVDVILGLSLKVKVRTSDSIWRQMRSAR